MREGQHGGHSWDPNSGKARQRSRQSMPASGWDGKESRETLRETRESSRGRQQVEGGGRLVVTLRESLGSRSSSRAGGEEERSQAVKEVSRGSLQVAEERGEVKRAEDIWRTEEIKRVEPRREDPLRRSGSIDPVVDSGEQCRMMRTIERIWLYVFLLGGRFEWARMMAFLRKSIDKKAVDIVRTGAQPHSIVFRGDIPYVTKAILNYENSTKYQNLPPKSYLIT